MHSLPVQRSTGSRRQPEPFVLPRSFYERSTLEVARDLLGKVLIHWKRGSVTAGMIVEAEAYIGETDPACHARAGLTARTGPLYGAPGHAYVYFSYGMHALLNVVTERQGFPAAVLLRALEPLEGIEPMQRRRARNGAGWIDETDLCSGPGKLTQAMGVTLHQNRIDLCGRSLYIEDRGLSVGPIGWSPRIGISGGKDRPWRAYLVGNPNISRTR